MLWLIFFKGAKKFDLRQTSCMEKFQPKKLKFDKVIGNEISILQGDVAGLK